MFGNQRKKNKHNGFDVFLTHPPIAIQHALHTDTSEKDTQQPRRLPRHQELAILRCEQQGLRETTWAKPRDAGKRL